MAATKSCAKDAGSMRKAYGSMGAAKITGAPVKGKKKAKKRG